MSDFEVKGTADFLRLSKALKAAGRTEMRKELNKRLRQAGKPLIPKIREAALRELPKKGGLAERMAKRPIRIEPRTGVDPGVKVVMPKTQEGYNDGVIRHPVFDEHKLGKGQFGPRAKPVPWVEQKIGPGLWFDDEIVANRDKVVPLIERAINSVLEDIVREAKRG